MQYDFIIIPDAGSNDFEEVKKLGEWDIKVLILASCHVADRWQKRYGGFNYGKGN